MKIHKVELEGFGPYRDREVVDFDAFEDDGIFLITGRTGAGKSSVLDAVTFALFGRLPRYEGMAGEKVRSDHIGPTDLCEVALEFSVPAGRYRVTRRPAYERPKKRGEGTTPVAPFFEMAVQRADRWEVLEAKVGNAERHIEEVFPLTPAQFQQVILLPQGEFQEFLVADSKVRRALLSRLFDTSRFTEYSKDLDSRATELRRRVERNVTQLLTQLNGLVEQVGAELPDTVDAESGNGVEEWLSTLLDTQEEALATARADQQAAEEKLNTARTALGEGRSLVERQQRLAHAVGRRAELNADADAIASTREAVALARRAAIAWQSVRAVEAAGQEERSSRAGVVRAESAFEEALGRVAPNARKSAQAAEALSTRIGALEEAQGLEVALPSLDMAHTLAQEEVAQHEEWLDSRLEERGRLQDEVGALDAELVTLAQLLTETEDAPLHLERADAGLAAAHVHVTYSARWGEALEQRVVAAAEAKRLSQLREDLLTRQYAEYAGKLADDLVDGADCPVCGSTEHPAKAVRSIEHVSSEQIEEVSTRLQWAEKQMAAADNDVTRMETRLADAAERSEGRSVEQWQQEVTRASEQVRRRTEAQRLQTARNESRPLLVARIDSLGSEIEEARLKSSRLTSQITVARQQWEAARGRVEAAKGDHASVAERVASLQQERQLLEQVITARSGFASAEQRLTAAHDAMELALVEQQFDGMDDVRAARLEDQVIEEHARSVADHESALAAVAQTLAEPELQHVPDRIVDVEGLTVAERDAGRVNAEFLQELGRVERQCGLVRSAAERIRGELVASSELRRDYGLVNSLAETLRGQGQNERKIMLESFALAAELEEIVAAANGRLARMTDGRYEFRHSDARAARGAQSGLELDVLDAHTGESRSPKSLSGGEKFQASLALALGLAEVVTARAGGLRLDTLFIDEGFGTLDPETLESTMATLDSLREGGRTVGLISHVGTLKEAIPAQLHVEVTHGGWSTLSQA